MMKVMTAVVVTDRRKVSVQDKATAAPVDNESDEHFSKSHIMKSTVVICFSSISWVLLIIFVYL